MKRRQNMNEFDERKIFKESESNDNSP
jgi:hypothetical protein